MTDFIDQDGAVLKLSPAPNHGAMLTLTDKTTVSITMTPGIALASSKLIVEATGLSDSELKTARMGKTPGYNKYGREGSAEAPIGDYTDKAGTTILIYPDKGNHVLIEVAGKHDTVYFSVAPSQALELMHTIRMQTGYSGEKLVLSAIREGLVNPEPPTERHDIKRDQRLREKNPAYARVIAALEGKTKPSGKAFIKPTQPPTITNPISRIALAAQTLGTRKKAA